MPWPVGKFVTPEEQDTIAKAYLRTEGVMTDHLEQQNRIDRFCTDPAGFFNKLERQKKTITVAMLLQCVGYWYRMRRWFTRTRYLSGRVELVALLQTRVLWLCHYINDTAFADLICKEVDKRTEHFDLARDEATKKLQELIHVSEDLDKRIHAWHEEIELKTRMFDAIPDCYIDARGKKQAKEIIEEIRKAA